MSGYSKFAKKDDTHKQSIAEKWVENCGGVRIADVSDSKLSGFDELVSFFGLLCIIEYKTGKPENVFKMLTEKELATYILCQEAECAWYSVTSFNDVQLVRANMMLRAAGTRARVSGYNHAKPKRIASA